MLAALMLQWLPILSHFIGSRQEVDLTVTYIPLAVGLIIATVLTAIFFLLRRRHRQAAFIGLVLGSLLLGYGYESRLSAIYPIFQALLPWTDFGNYQGVVFSVLFIVILVVGSYWTGRLLENKLSRRPKLAADTPAAIFIAISITFLLQLIPCIRIVASEWTQLAYKPPALGWNAAIQNSSKPDIYYIVLDDQSGPDVMKSQLGYDESDFVKSLQSLGYYVPTTTYANYPNTTLSVASTMSANYLGDIVSRFSGSHLQTFIPSHRTIQYSPVAQELKSLGYQYVELGNWYETSTRSPLADDFYEPFSQLTVFGHTTVLENWALGQINQSVLWRFMQAGLLGMHYSNADGPNLPLDQLQKLNNEASTNSGGRFIFAHILLPHEPYYFNADGSISNDVGTDNNGELLKTKYINQVTYTNNEIEGVLKQINRVSQGKAVVILQSDEGSPQVAEAANYGSLSNPANSGHDDDENTTNPSWPTANLQLKYSIEAAYHIPGASQASLIAGANPVNVYRLLFNTDFGTSLPYLAQCYYSYSTSGSAKPLSLTSVSKQLTGQANPACAPDGSGPR